MIAATTKAKAAHSDISPDWALWIHKLATTLEQLKEDEYLVISTKRGNRYVQFAGQGSYGMRAETSSNEFIDKNHNLTPAQTAMLVAAGWHKPTHKSTAAADKRDPHGSPNFYYDAEHPVQYNRVAELTVRTFAEILGVPHPGYLQYHAFESDGKVLEFPGLGLKQSSQTEDEQNLKVHLLRTMRDLSKLPALDYDEDGELGVGVNNVVVYVSLIESGDYIRFRTHMLKGVKKQAGIYESLNRLNATGDLVRYVYGMGIIYSILDVPALPFSAEHVARHFFLCADLGNGIGASLKAQFDGRPAASHPLTSSAIN